MKHYLLFAVACSAIMSGCTSNPYQRNYVSYVQKPALKELTPVYLEQMNWSELEERRTELHSTGAEELGVSSFKHVEVFPHQARSFAKRVGATRVLIGVEDGGVEYLSSAVPVYGWPQTRTSQSSFSGHVGNEYFHGVMTTRETSPSAPAYIGVTRPVKTYRVHVVFFDTR